MKTNLTKKEVGQKIAKILKKFYTGNMMDITIGLTTDGNVDYNFDAHGIGKNEIVVVFYETKNGWALDNHNNPDDPDFWSNDVLEWIGEVLTDPRTNNIFDIDGNRVNVEYAG